MELQNYSLISPQEASIAYGRRNGALAKAKSNEGKAHKVVSYPKKTSKEMLF